MGRARQDAIPRPETVKRKPGASSSSRTRAKREAAPRVAVAPLASDLPAAIEGLDRTIHEKARLAIVSVLASAGEATFSELKELARLTDGNLSVHARVLEEAGFIKVRKGFQGRRPRTTYALTANGLRAFRRYVESLERIVAGSRGVEPTVRRS